MTKPALPSSVEVRLPVEITNLIYTFVPHYRKKKTPPAGLQSALEKLQKSPKRTPMDMYGYCDFVLC